MAQDSQLPPDEDDPFKITLEFGRGSDGVVYLAEDSRVGHSVALKVLAESDFPFLTDALAASKLGEAEVCKVYETAEETAKETAKETAEEDD